MARLKKSPRPLTRKQQIDSALKLLVLSRKKFKLPALSDDEREQCRTHFEELLNAMASVRADAERPWPTRAEFRAALAALKRHKKTSEVVAAAGGGVASLDMPLHPDAVLRGGIDLKIAWLESRLRPQRLGVRAFPSPKKTAVALAYELVTGWAGGANAAPPIAMGYGLSSRPSSTTKISTSIRKCSLSTNGYARVRNSTAIYLCFPKNVGLYLVS